MKLKNKASVVVIGGGVVGNSVAYNLAKRGVKDIVLVEMIFFWQVELQVGVGGQGGLGSNGGELDRIAF